MGGRGQPRVNGWCVNGFQMLMRRFRSAFSQLTSTSWCRRASPGLKGAAAAIGDGSAPDVALLGLWCLRQRSGAQVLEYMKQECRRIFPVTFLPGKEQ